ncbi:hypothetical protein [Erythrobacter tepidarius]|uniref:hypothetical protein n=1 Tax=Erythrobacter tepidarius TaxID=60454 RepID=UPI000A3B451A|nr:hypothetical protein [Erythrobacter tepidarius]
MRPWKGLFLRGEVAASGNTPLNPENIAFQDAVVLIGGQIGWETEHWSARLYFENLTDELVFNTNFFANFAFGNDGTLYARVTPPRVVGLQLNYRWLVHRTGDGAATFRIGSRHSPIHSVPAMSVANARS